MAAPGGSRNQYEFIYREWSLLVCTSKSSILVLMRTLLSFALSSGRHCLCFEGQFHSLAVIFCCINYLSTIVDKLKLKFVRKRIDFVNNLTIKHCVKAKVKTITVKNSKNCKNFKKRRHFDVYSTSFSSQNE